MNRNMTTSKTGNIQRIRGPRRLEYIPESVRHVEGVEVLTTMQQLTRLKDYLETPPAARAPYIRLGASVYSYERNGAIPPPMATYAVDVDGTVRVFRKNGDPRVLHRWMTRPTRAWNLCRNPRFKGSASIHPENAA